MPTILITDNGSYRPESTFSLRALAQALGERVGAEVHPVSLLHSTKIDPADLNGKPAQIFEPFLKKCREEFGENEFMVVPMFFGPSAAIKEYMPQRVAYLQENGWPELRVKIAPCVVDGLDATDHRMARILADLVEEKTKGEGIEQASVVLCDHGAPRLAVTEVRNFLAAQMRSQLDPNKFPHLIACAMERREEPEYAYNEPLLEHVLHAPEFQNSKVIVSMLFASPGRHAGPGGDVAQICRAAEERIPGLKVHLTELVGTHPGLIDILSERYQQGLLAPPCGTISH